MSSIGCDSNNPSKSLHQNPSNNTYIISAGRENKLEQTFGLDRESQQLTRSMEIALEEHRLWHIENKSFNSIEALNLHQELMTSRILIGDDFLTAHSYAVNHGPSAN